MPWGLAPFESLSATDGIPADVENRTVTGVDGRAACGAQRQLGSGGGRSERAGVHHTLGVNGSETRVHSSVQFIEGLDQVGGEWGRHDTHLLGHGHRDLW